MIQYVEIIKLKGNLNASSIPEFRKKVNETLENGTKVLLIDCQDVSFIDSSGLGALVLAFKALRAANIRMAICSINEQVRILFELTGMDEVFEIFPNQDTFHKVL
jgi:anti-anti-sigma factor